MAQSKQSKEKKQTKKTTKRNKKKTFSPKRRVCLEVSYTEGAQRRGQPTSKGDVENFSLQKGTQQSSDP